MLVASVVAVAVVVAVMVVLTSEAASGKAGRPQELMNSAALKPIVEPSSSPKAKRLNYYC